MSESGEDQAMAAATAAAAPVTKGAQGTWWGGLVNIAKQKSASAMDFVRKDIEEFKTTMQQDSAFIASSVKSKLQVEEEEARAADSEPEEGGPGMMAWIGGLQKALCTQENASTATQKMKQGMSTLIGGLQRVLIIPPDSDDEETITANSHVFDRAKARLHAIQTDQSTYSDPPEEPEKFESFLHDFDLDVRKGDISELLVSNVEVRALYTAMVPSTVSHADFWHRYFYKLHLLNEDQMRREQLMRRADVTDHESDLAWDDEDDWGEIEGGSPHPPSSLPIAAGAAAPGDTAAPEAPETPGADPLPSPGSEEDVLSQLETLEMPEAELDEQTVDKVLKEEFSERGVTGEGGQSPAADSIQPKPDSSNDSDRASDIAHPSEPPEPPAETPNRPSEGASPADDTDSRVAMATPDPAADAAPLAELATKVRGDLVVVGSTGSGSDGSPSSTVSSAGNNKESLDEDWEQDFDIEVTEEDLRLAQEAARHAAEAGDTKAEQEDDWENWE